MPGFLLRNGAFTTIEFSGASFTTAQGINARGDIVGYFGEASGLIHAFLLHDGAFTTIDVPGTTVTRGRGINARGRIVGDDGAKHIHGFQLLRR